MNTAKIPEDEIITDHELKIPKALDPANKQNHLVAILGVVIIMLILILAGLYLLSTTAINPFSVFSPTAQITTGSVSEPENTNFETVVEVVPALSDSDEISAIEVDLQNTDLENLDAELINIDTEFTVLESR